MNDSKQTSGIGVYCKCGGIIYCCTDDCYSRDKTTRKEVENYTKRGFQVSRVSKADVQSLFGCKCQHELPKSQLELFK